jgi:PadR family transcriptional regulator PadR
MGAHEPDLFENLRLELRRGCLVLAVLIELRTERYGYALRKALSDSGLEIDENTLYPLLRRLESQNLLESQWRVEEKRNKRFYRLSGEGQKVLERLLAEWRGINESIGRLLEGANDESGIAGPVHLRGEDPVAVEQAG